MLFRSKIVNVVKANATAVRGEAPEEVSATATVTAEAAAAKLSITKTANPTSNVKIGRASCRERV